MKILNAIIICLIVSSCTFFSKHPEIFEDVKLIEKETVDAISQDAKTKIDSQKIVDEKVVK